MLIHPQHIQWGGSKPQSERALGSTVISPPPSVLIQQPRCEPDVSSASSMLFVGTSGDRPETMTFDQWYEEDMLTRLEMIWNDYTDYYTSQHPDTLCIDLCLLSMDADATGSRIWHQRYPVSWKYSIYKSFVAVKSKSKHTNLSTNQQGKSCNGPTAPLLMMLAA